MASSDVRPRTKYNYELNVVKSCPSLVLFFLFVCFCLIFCTAGLFCVSYLEFNSLGPDLRSMQHGKVLSVYSVLSPPCLFCFVVFFWPPRIEKWSIFPHDFISYISSNQSEETNGYNLHVQGLNNVITVEENLVSEYLCLYQMMSVDYHNINMKRYFWRNILVSKMSSKFSWTFTDSRSVLSPFVLQPSFHPGQRPKQVLYTAAKFKLHLGGKCSIFTDVSRSNTEYTLSQRCVENIQTEDFEILFFF